MSLINKKKKPIQSELKNFLTTRSFAIYGMGKTGLSVINYLKNNNNLNITYWDDDKEKKSYII